MPTTSFQTQLLDIYSSVSGLLREVENHAFHQQRCVVLELSRLVRVLFLQAQRPSLLHKPVSKASAYDQTDSVVKLPARFVTTRPQTPGLTMDALVRADLAVPSDTLSPTITLLQRGLQVCDLQGIAVFTAAQPHVVVLSAGL